MLVNWHRFRARYLCNKTILSLLLALVAFIGAAHLLVRSSVHGLLLTWDSMAFLSTAENLAAGQGLRDYTYGFFEAWWPPFYPIFLAFINLFGINVFEASRFINIVAFGLISLLTSHWLSRYIKSYFLVIGAAILIIISHTIAQIASFALTDTIFILLTLLALMNLESFLKQRDPIFFALSALFASLAPITRYIGITVILTATILILIDQRLLKSKRLRYATIYTATSSIPLVIVFVMNQVVTGHYAGRRWATGQTLSESLKQIGDTLSVWFYASEPTETWLDSDYLLLLEPPNWVPYYLLIVAILSLLMGLLVFRPYKRRKNLPDLSAEVMDSTPGLISIITFPLVYTISLIVSVPIAAGQAIDFRYLAPIYVPVLMLILVFLERLFRANLEGWVHAIRLSAVILLIFSFAMHVNRAVRWNVGTTAIAMRPQGQYVYGYSQNSPIIAYLNANPLNGNIYNNGGMNVLYQLTDIPAPVRYIPRGTVEDCLDWISSNFANSSEPAYIVYLIRDHLIWDYCDPRELASQSQYLDIVIEKSDGVVYRIVPTVSPNPS